MRRRDGGHHGRIDPLTNDESPLADCEVHYLPSVPVGDEFKIFVGHCGTIGVRARAVLYLTDANGFFGSAVDVIRSMQLSIHLPPMLVVGIGYRAAGLGDTIPLRTRDLTPSPDEAFAHLYPDITDMGGGSRLLEFIRTELMPWVSSHFEVDPEDAAYFGHSMGGLFGTYVLLNEPATFQRYAISSPSLWWADELLFEEEERYAGAHDDLAAKVFFSVGAYETQEGRAREAVNCSVEERRRATAWYIDMVDEMVRMVDRLSTRGYPSLQLASAIFPDEFHITVPQLSLSRGLRYLYDAPR